MRPGPLEKSQQGQAESVQTGVDLKCATRKADTTFVATSRDIIRDLRFDNLEIPSVEPVPIVHGPLFVREVSREPVRVQLAQFVDQLVGTPSIYRDYKSGASCANGSNQFWVEVDQVGLLMEVAGGYVLFVVGLKDTPQEVD